MFRHLQPRRLALSQGRQALTFISNVSIAENCEFGLSDSGVCNLRLGCSTGPRGQRLFCPWTLSSKTTTTTTTSITTNHQGTTTATLLHSGSDGEHSLLISQICTPAALPTSRQIAWHGTVTQQCWVANVPKHTVYREQE